MYLNTRFCIPAYITLVAKLYVHDRWERFGKRLSDEFYPLKEKLMITIYGSYQPKTELTFLRQQMAFLIDKGYTRTMLVEDYHKQYLELSSLEISTYCLRNSDVNFFIFTKDGKNQGVSVELQIAATDQGMIDKVKHCIVFDQIRDNYGSVSALSLDQIDNSGIVKRDFVDEEDLQTAMLQKAFSSLRRLQNEIRRR